jgi:hypothetical protein
VCFGQSCTSNMNWKTGIPQKLRHSTIFIVWLRTGGIPVFTIHIAGTALPKTHYFPLMIALALSFEK